MTAHAIVARDTIAVTHTIIAIGNSAVSGIISIIGELTISIGRSHRRANVVTIYERDIVIIAISIIAGIGTIDNSNIVNVSISYNSP